MLAWQAQAVGRLYDVAIGSGGARLTGFFSHAGVAGTFAILIGMLSMVLTEAGNRKRVLLLISALLISGTAGSRFGMIAVSCFVIGYVDELTSSGGYRRYRLASRVFLLLLGSMAFVYLYTKVNEVADRGDLLQNQTEEGGRIANLAIFVNLISEVDLLSALFGQGIGVATNNAANLVAEHPSSTSGLLFNSSMDNTIIMVFLQFGAVGSCLFWAGLAMAWMNIYVELDQEAKSKQNIILLFVLLSFISTSLFEQFFLVIGVPLAVGINGAGSFSKRRGQWPRA